MDVLPVNICLLTLNEAYHLRQLLPELGRRVAQITIIDSYSTDGTVDVALAAGAMVVQRAFTDFSEQWNFALSLPTEQPWTMKLDPDERISEDLYDAIESAVSSGQGECVGYALRLRLWFMGKPLHVGMEGIRLWRTGTCRFSEVLVNEHPVIDGEVGTLPGFIEHLDSKDLSHWVGKQNHYTTLEAITVVQGRGLAAAPRLFGTKLERRMWLKKNLFRVPFRYQAMWLYNYLISGAWRDGREGRAWASMRVWVYRMIELKAREMRRAGVSVEIPLRGAGAPDPRVSQH